MSKNTKADLEEVLRLAVTSGAVPVQSYQKTSTSGKSFQVSAATRGAPGPKNGITNPGGALRSGLSTGRLANEAGHEVGEAMGSRNTVTVGSSGIGRSPLSPYAASGVATPPHTAGALAAAANAATAGASIQSTAVANQAASAASHAANVSAATSAAKKAPYNFVTYPKKAATPYTAYPKSSSSGSSSSSSSGSSKLASALSITSIGMRAASLGHGGLAGGHGGNGVGSALKSMYQRSHNTASRDASKTASEHARETASRDAHNTASRDARETARRDGERAGHRAEKDVTSLSVAEIIDLQMALSLKGYPVKVDGRLCNEFITIAEAYFKAAK